MKLAQGNMWKTPADCYVVTTNQYVTVTGKLVMGRGAALYACNNFQGIDKALGTLIHLFGYSTPYYLLYAGRWTKLAHDFPLGPTATKQFHVWAFQVKIHYREDARLDLIKTSALALARTAKHYPDKSWSLNFPGTGNGRLKREDVLPLLKCLPDNVTVWEF